MATDHEVAVLEKFEEFKQSVQAVTVMYSEGHPLTHGAAVQLSKWRADGWDIEIPSVADCAEWIARALPFLDFIAWDSRRFIRHESKFLQGGAPGLGKRA